MFLNFDSFFTFSVKIFFPSFIEVWLTNKNPTGLLLKDTELSTKSLQIVWEFSFGICPITEIMCMLEICL